MDFDKTKTTYSNLINNSIRFSGKDHDFFTSVKADFLKLIVKEFLPHLKFPTLLDIGCGHGFIHSHLYRDFKITGVEIANEVLELAKKSNNTINYLNYDGKNLPFDQNSFDIAMAICVMHHVPPSEWSNFLFEMKRVIKPNGLVIIFEHNPYNPLTRLIVSKNILDSDAVLLSRSTLKKLMIQSGFKKIKNRFILFTPFGRSFFRWLDKKLGQYPLGAQYYMVGKKD